MKFSLLLSLVAALLLWPAVAGATGGAWNRDADGYYIRLEVSSTTASHEYAQNGSLVLLFPDTTLYSDGSYGITEINFYAEYGFTPWLTAVASTQYKVAVREAASRTSGRDTTASASGLGDIWIASRVRLLPETSPLVVSISLAVKLPSGSPMQQLPLGSGVLDYEGAISAGESFNLGTDINGYAQISAGYRLRNRASNEVNWLLETGLNPSRWLMLQGKLDGVVSEADFAAASENISTGIYILDQSFTRFSIAAVYTTSSDLQLGLGYSTLTSGRNALALSGIAFSVAWQR